MEDDPADLDHHRPHRHGTMAPLSPDVARRLRDFAGWFDQHCRELEQLAAAQKPMIDEVQAMLARSATCRPPRE